ncbi:Beta-amylase 1, chloroplastic [Porphyridium purpureum]|uniref:Beta-amylase n=1 Tax=Porphyridium purpureum TaxID=35688 RepID=A0A5J4Z296_PORPP|nr:Beta-amylase 1, chloroplastic [Porphyridium purpureum]|eukprot:POR3682..scf208_2
MGARASQVVQKDAVVCDDSDRAIVPAQALPVTTWLELARAWLQLPALHSWLARVARRMAGKGSSSVPSGPKQSVPVYVMFPLEFGLDDAEQPVGFAEMVEEGLQFLASMDGVAGIMVDVWWGPCEPQPGKYVFDKYLRLAQRCKELGLHIQATMSFHQCGGNVGDTAYIPLPQWVRECATREDAWYMDYQGDQDFEYICCLADHEPILHGRTPVQCYADFVCAFCVQLEPFMGKAPVVTEIQIGCGPCGEVRFPSYRMHKGKWSFPGIGSFQCFDRRMRQSLQQSVKQQGKPELFAEPVVCRYNDTLQSSEFFGTHSSELPQYSSERGRFFMEWYSECLVKHMNDVLGACYKEISALPFSSNPPRLSIKISGVHWYHNTRCKPAEACAGYYVSDSYDFYARVASSLAALREAYPAFEPPIFNFTCLEMLNRRQPSGARCDPENLVRHVLRVCRAHGVVVAGENAIEGYAWRDHYQIRKFYKMARGMHDGFTYLRLGRKMLRHKSAMRRFVQSMQNV